MPSAPASVDVADADATDLMRRYRQDNWRGIQTPRWQRRIVEEILTSQHDHLFGLLGGVQTLQGLRVVDVGCGVGSFVRACHSRGIAAIGVEPERIGVGATTTALDVARVWCGPASLVSGAGEDLPLSTGSCDVVTLNHVLEHVPDPVALLREALRVTAASGVVYLASPNYLYPWEPHYKVPWLPLMPRSAGRAYLRVLGRDPTMLDQLTYTSHRRLRRAVELAGGKVVDVHWEAIRERLEQPGAARRPLAKLVAALWRQSALERVRPALTTVARAAISVRSRGVEYLVRHA